MRTGSLTCEACHGSLPISVELVLSTPCPYCGRDVILPDQRERREAIERAREAEARRRHDALKSAERERTRRLGLRWKVIGALVAVLLVVGPIAYLVRRAVRTAEEERVARFALVAEEEARHRRSGLVRLQEMIDRAQGGACGEVFVKPSAAAGQVESRFSLGVRSCARILATTGDAAAKVELAIVGGDGKPVAGPAPARELDHLYCPRRLGGTQQVRASAPGTDLSLAVVSCDRTIPTDPAGVGATRVAELMKEQLAAGCRHVLLPARTYANAQTMTASLEPRTCVHIVVATGMPDNDLTVQLMTPIGEKVAGPPPGLEAVLSHCSAEGGKHSGTVDAALLGPFTAAAVSCPMRGRRSTRRGR